MRRTSSDSMALGLWQRLTGPLRASLGGPAQLRAVFLLAAVLTVASADSATVGAIGSDLEQALRIGNGQIGLLVSVSTGVGALATLPVGVLVDRVSRTRLLAISLLLWCAAMIASGAAVSYPMLLVSRLALGAVVATATPAVASIIGDLFPAADRGRAYGLVLTGELLGAGVGLLAGGDIAAVLGWRAAFWALAVPSLVLAAVVHYRFPEPTRREHDTSDAGSQDATAKNEAMRQRISPRPHLVLRSDPTGRPLWWVIRYVLSIPTNVALILASGIGYFFFAGLRTFAVVFLQQRFGFGQAAASSLIVLIGAGAIIGVLASGRFSDRTIRRHQMSGRPVVAGVAFLAVAVLFVPALLVSTFAIAGVLLFLGAAALGATNPPLDAARLDIMHSRLWGRAESVRTVLRSALQAFAPVLFGYLSTAAGLDHTFLIMLVPVVLAGLILLHIARRTYPRDVATAAASEHAGSAGTPPSP